uniref:FLYWCH-type domain-containing protein n=1 Tax=Panagrolaimus superbus TaxID=310955 RepID=A0A914YUX3_9BILA
MEEFTFDIRPTTGTNPALFVNGNKHFLRAKNKKGSTHWVCYLNKGSKRCQGKARTEITNGKIELANVWDHTCQCTNSTDKTIMSHIDSTKTASPITKHDKHESTKAIQKKKKTIKTVHPADPNYQTLKDLNGDDIFTRKQPTKESDDSGVNLKPGNLD